jgi:hypothetical protein
MVTVKWDDDSNSVESATWDDGDSGGSSSTSTTSNDYSTTDASVSSGTVNALTRDGKAESEQLATVEEEMDGALDSHAVTTTTTSDGSTSVTAESNLGETVTATTVGTPMADAAENVPAAPEMPDLSAKQIAAALIAVVLVVWGS